MNKKLCSKHLVLILITIIPLFLAAAYIQFQEEKPEVEQLEPPEATQPEKQKRYGIPTLSDIEIKTPEIALKYGIKGYIDITLANETPKTLTIKEGELNVMILLHFVSHTPKLTETIVNLDPKGEGLTAGRYLLDGRLVKLNNYVSYHPSGQIKMKSGQTLPVIITISVTEDFPSISIPLRAVGITADVPIIDNLNVDVRRHG